MSIWKSYYLANSLEEARSLLKREPSGLKIVAGGTDLLLEIQQGSHPPVDTLVDVTQIPELCTLELQEDAIFIGAAVPVSRITTSPIVHEHAMAVAEATGLIGGPQVRNTATLGGNVAHALPAADGMISLVAMNANAVVSTEDGFEERPILSLFRGPGQTSLSKDEILVGFKIKKKENGESSAFSRVMRPQGVALPILNLAVWLRCSGELIEDIHITFGPSGPVPQRAEVLENVFRGNQYGSKILTQAKQVLHESLHFRTSRMRATSEYRHELAEVLLEKVIKLALERIEGWKNGK